MSKINTAQASGWDIIESSNDIEDAHSRLIRHLLGIVSTNESLSIADEEPAYMSSVGVSDRRVSLFLREVLSSSDTSNKTDNSANRFPTEER